jgi:phosphoserine aminotransferase
MSHRGKQYDAVHTETIALVREILQVPDSSHVLLLQGGATLQFGMVPMAFLKPGMSADYITTGSWAKKALGDAQAVGDAKVAWDGAECSYTRIPEQNDLTLNPEAAYVHICSNETISGTQVKEFPNTAAPLIADMSSDILSRPLDITQFGMIYAGAQKNLGPAGVTLVIIRDDLAKKSPETLPDLFQYKHVKENDSLSNTAPTFPIYMLGLVTRWLLDKGGLDGIQQQNEEKAGKLYAAIDASEFYKGTALEECRSPMNVTFRLPTEELEAEFVAEAAKQGMTSLKGHRSVGGIRASIYNAFPPAGVDALISFMKEFEAQHG